MSRSYKISPRGRRRLGFRKQVGDDSIIDDGTTESLEKGLSWIAASEQSNLFMLHTAVHLFTRSSKATKQLVKMLLASEWTEAVFGTELGQDNFKTKVPRY